MQYKNHFENMTNKRNLYEQGNLQNDSRFPDYIGKANTISLNRMLFEMFARSERNCYHRDTYFGDYYHRTNFHFSYLLSLSIASVEDSMIGVTADVISQFGKLDNVVS
jgi:hypothetical protein